MLLTQCPLCGHETLAECHGDYRFDPPPNVAGGVVIVPNASWWACGHCHEAILPRFITKAIELERRRRLETAVAVSP
ncbi:MAG: YgiT-type zinc finger protein [Planctomycetaceae bacterium]